MHIIADQCDGISKQRVGGRWVDGVQAALLDGMGAVDDSATYSPQRIQQHHSYRKPATGGLWHATEGGMQATMLCEIVQRLADLQSVLLEEMAATCKPQWRNRTLMQMSSLAACSRSGGNADGFEPGIMSRADHCEMSGDLAAACGLLFTQWRVGCTARRFGFETMRDSDAIRIWVGRKWQLLTASYRHMFDGFHTNSWLLFWNFESN